jgi:protein-tyrosine phosphatase
MSNTPFKISRLALDPRGEIALSRMPGSVTCIEDDVAEIVALNCACVLTLAPHEELIRHGAHRLPSLLMTEGIEWHHFPIVDYATPLPSQERAWSDLSERLHDHLNNNRTILVHCYAGVGRSGMIALRLLVEQGANPEEALKQIRQVRPGAVERPAQYEWAIANIK